MRFERHVPAHSLIEARYFAFLFPDPDVDRNPDSAKDQCLKRLINGHDRCLGLLIRNGGFVYFSCDLDDKLEPTVLRVCCIKAIGAAQFELSFGQWELVSPEVEAMLHEQNRFHEITLTALRDEGVTKFTWVCPMEEFGGDLFQYGGFVYGFQDGTRACCVPIAKMYDSEVVDSEVFATTPTAMPKIDDADTVTNNSFPGDKVTDLELDCQKDYVIDLDIACNSSIPQMHTHGEVLFTKKL